MTKLAAVYSHEEIFVGGVFGVLPKTLTTSTKKFGGVNSIRLELSDSENFVVLTVNEKNTYWVPSSNFKLVVPE